MVTAPPVSWLVFKVRAKHPYLNSYGASEQRLATSRMIHFRNLVFRNLLADVPALKTEPSETGHIAQRTEP
jgi:hypothetical protein